MRFNKLLLSELRVIEAGENKDVKADQGSLEKALVDIENLNALGYEFSEEGIVRLAQDYKANPNMTPIYAKVMEYEPSIEVSPMYPNFPTQVKEMDELEFRTHQIIHYLTTYGIEDLFDEEVTEGWLPQYEVEPRAEDERVIELKMLDYLYKEEVNQKVVNDLLGKKERLNRLEIELAKTVAIDRKEPVENVPFKENIGKVFGDLLLNGDLEERYDVFSVLSTILKHPGDVLDLLEYVIIENRYKHLKTSVKRGFVELLESFPVEAVEVNLADHRWSNAFLGKGGKPRTRNRNISLIDYLSFNRFSKKEEVKEVVNDLKDGKLKSWNQILEKRLQDGKYDEALNMLAGRPGILFRQVNRLMGLGVEATEISKIFDEKAEELKTQSVISALNNFEGDKEVVDVFKRALVANLVSREVKEIKDKKVYIDSHDVDFDMSKIEITDKNEEGGYITNGLAIKIPDDVEIVRFFTYWNDKNRIDMDLHAALTNDGKVIEHIGWNGRFRSSSNAVVHSGDITHSDAAEYIDVDLDKAKAKNVDTIQLNINSFTEVPFNEIDEVFTGLMAVSEMKAEANLFDPKNVMFRHDLEYKFMGLDYGLIDIENRLLYIIGAHRSYHNDVSSVKYTVPNLSVSDYLKVLTLSQNATIVDNEDEADVTLGLAKADKENYYSLIDENYFLE